MSYLVIVNGKIESETSTESQARTLAEEGALRGSPCKVVKVVAECAPFPVPTWTEVQSAGG